MINHYIYISDELLKEKRSCRFSRFNWKIFRSFVLWKAASFVDFRRTRIQSLFMCFFSMVFLNWVSRMMDQLKRTTFSTGRKRAFSILVLCIGKTIPKATFPPTQSVFYLVDDFYRLWTRFHREKRRFFLITDEEVASLKMQTTSGKKVNRCYNSSRMTDPRREEKRNSMKYF